MTGAITETASLSPYQVLNAALDTMTYAESSAARSHLLGALLCLLGDDPRALDAVTAAVAFARGEVTELSDPSTTI